MLSTGGGDKCVLQWRAVGVNAEDSLNRDKPWSYKDEHNLVHDMPPVMRRKESPWCERGMYEERM